MKWKIPDDPWGNTLPPALFLLIGSDYFLFSNLKWVGYLDSRIRSGLIILILDDVLHCLEVCKSFNI